MGSGGRVPVIRQVGSAFRTGVECARPLETTTPANGGRSGFSGSVDSAVVIAGCNARNVRAIKSNVGQFPIAELGQLRDIALIVAEGLNHSDEREQHG